LNDQAKNDIAEPRRPRFVCRYCGWTAAGCLFTEPGT